MSLREWPCIFKDLSLLEPVVSIKNLAGNAAILVLLVCAVTMTWVVARREVFHRGGSSGAGTPQPDRQVSDWAGLSAVGHRIGPDHATVTVVEFGDFECPACRVFANTAIKGIRASFPNDVALVFRHWPLSYHRFSYPAARAAECVAAQGRFESFFEAVYARQDSLGLKSFEQFAVESGVSDPEAFKRCNAESGRVPAIEADVAVVKALTARGTPTIIINGLQLGSVPDSARFDRIVRDELARAKQK